MRDASALVNYAVPPEAGDPCERTITVAGTTARRPYSWIDYGGGNLSVNKCSSKVESTLISYASLACEMITFKTAKS